MIPFEADNVQAYRLLLWIEIAIRECTRYCMINAHGKYWKRKIPGELLKIIRQSENEEDRPHFHYTRLGPLYYLTLGELVPILRNKTSGGVAKMLGGDWVINDIEKILGLRNAICHARPVPPVGLTAISALYEQMRTALSSHDLLHIISTPDIGVFPNDTAKLLIPWMGSLKEQMRALEHPLKIDAAYEIATQQYWWGISELSGFDCATLERVSTLIIEYNALPTGVGSAGKRQWFSDENEALQAVEIATIELKRVLQ